MEVQISPEKRIELYGQSGVKLHAIYFKNLVCHRARLSISGLKFRGFLKHFSASYLLSQPVKFKRTQILQNVAQITVTTIKIPISTLFFKFQIK